MLLGLRVMEGSSLAWRECSLVIGLEAGFLHSCLDSCWEGCLEGSLERSDHLEGG